MFCSIHALVYLRIEFIFWKKNMNFKVFTGLGFPSLLMTIQALPAVEELKNVSKAIKYVYKVKIY